MFLLLLLLAVPTAEIFIFIEVGGEIGAWPTVGLIIGTALVGGAILRFQGLQTLARAQQQLARKQLPIMEMAEGAGLALAAVLLLTPGFFTDVLGALLLVPPLRRLAVLWVLSRARARGTWTVDGDGPQSPRPDGRDGGGPIIDGEYREVDETADEDLPPPRGSWNKRS